MLDETLSFVHFQAAVDNIKREPQIFWEFSDHALVAYQVISPTRESTHQLTCAMIFYNSGLAVSLHFRPVSLTLQDTFQPLIEITMLNGHGRCASGKKWKAIDMLMRPFYVHIGIC